MNKMILYHGSINIIDKPIFGKGKAYNDYGLGLYLTEELELAKEWAVDEYSDGYVNEYELDLNNIKIMDLSKDYNTLNWIAILLKNRSFSIKNDIARLGKEYLLNNYLLSYEEYDVIIGYRADDSYFSYAEAFLNNTISLNKLSEALKIGNLGMQVVLKSQKAFNQLKFINYFEAKKEIYYPLRLKRNLNAKDEYSSTKRKKISSNDIFLNDIMRGALKKWFTLIMIFIYQ